MDSTLNVFYKQYLQQVTNLTYPPSKWLAHYDIQQQIFRYFFDNANADLPHPEYQRRVLKRLTDVIEKEAKDEDDHVSDELMAHMGHLSSIPRKSDPEAAQELRVLSYFLPEQTTDTSGKPFDGKDGSVVLRSVLADRVLIRESPQLLAAGSNVGLRTWEACLRLAYYLCTSSTASSLRNANVLELGAGTGLLSLICSMHLEAKHVIATDGLGHVVSGIEDNVKLNKQYNTSQSTNWNMPSAAVLDWTEPSQIDDALHVADEDVRIDYVLGADITYHPELLEPLASILANLKERFPNNKTLISATVRNEVTMGLWEEACKKHDLIIRIINKGEDGWQCPQYRSQTGLFHEQAFPIIIMDITSRGKEVLPNLVR